MWIVQLALKRPYTFAVMALLCMPVALGSTVEWADWWRAWSSAPALTFLAILVFPITWPRIGFEPWD